MSELTLMLSLLGQPALMVSSAGVCTGYVVAPGVLVLEACPLWALAPEAEPSLYVDGEAPIEAWTAYEGRAPGRLVVHFRSESEVR